MTKHEFLDKLADALKKYNVSDTTDIISEYEQHFAFKLADGFSEEEIAAKLGNPAQLAAQFESSAAAGKGGGKKLITVIGLGFIDLFIGILYALLIGWGVVMAAFALACAATSVCLIGGLNIYALMPAMPYLPAVILGIAFAALAVLTILSCFYFWAFAGQLMRSYARFHHNTIAAASGGAVLPPLTVYPQLSAKARRKLRSVALIAFVVFATFFVLAIMLSMISAGAIEFWHVWGWFGYAGTY